MFELSGVSVEVARESMRLAAHKLPVQTKFVIRDTETAGDFVVDEDVLLDSAEVQAGDDVEAETPATVEV
jgi:hypothetical protein